MKYFSRLYRSYRALRRGRKIYYVPDFDRLCFASSDEQCSRKFLRHKIVRPNWWMSVCFVLFGFKERNACN